MNVHLTAEGAAVTLAALLVIAVFMAVTMRRTRDNKARAKYLRGEQDREVQRLKADVLEQINIDLRRFHAP